MNGKAISMDWKFFGVLNRLMSQYRTAIMAEFFFKAH